MYAVALSNVETVKRKVYSGDGPDDRQLAVANCKCRASGGIVRANDERILPEPHEGDAE